MPLTISIPDEMTDTAARVLESLTGFHVRISFTSPNGPWLDMDTVEIAGLTPDGDLITRDVLDGFTNLGTSTFDVETIRRVTVI